MSLTQVTFPCSVNSIPFYPAVSMQRSVDAVKNFGQSSYIDSLLYWQGKLRYNYKCLFNDVLSFQFKIQLGFGIANLKVYSSKIDSNGYPVPDKEVTAFTVPLTTAQSLGGFYWGSQSPINDTYTDPVSGFSIRLQSYMWSFSFGDILDPATDSGIYFIVHENVEGMSTFLFYSEPILVYGTSAKKIFPNTLLFEATNLINKNDILIDGWGGTDFGLKPVFRTRCEADILDYEPKGIYTGFLQQNWEANMLYSQSWKTFTLNLGSITNGVPAVFFEILSKIMEMDLITINNQYYIYDIVSGGGSSPSNAWKVVKNRLKGLFHGALPIRYKFANQFYAPAVVIDGRIFTDEFDDTFA